MASNFAHRSTGLAVGIIAAAIVWIKVSEYRFVLTVSALIGGYLGGTAPDWLELAWWSRRPGKRLWIAHRTWTHWGLAWLALFYYAYTHLGYRPWAAPLFGFAAGGLMHLLADWPNPLGVPWLFRKRYSLQWWNSGRCDYLIIAVIWTTALFVADSIWFNNNLLRYVQNTTQDAIALLPRSHVAILARWLYPFV